MGAAWRQLRKISAEASLCGGGDWAGGGLQDMLKDTTEVIEIQVWVTRVINTQCNREVCQPPSGQGADGEV